MFRFTIRDVLLLTVIVALGLGWSLRELQLRAEANHIQRRLDSKTMLVRKLAAIMESAGWKVELTDQDAGSLTPPKANE